MILFLSTVAYAQSVCTKLYSTLELSSSIDSATIAFVQQDPEKLQTHIEQLESIIPCLDEPIEPSIAATFHITEGMFFAISGETLKAKQSFAIGKAIDSSITIPTYIYPSGHPIQNAFESTQPATRKPVDVPDNQEWYFDGLPQGRPLDTPTIFQVRQKDAVIYSGYLTPYSDLGFKPRTLKKDNRARNIWLWTAGSLVSAGFSGSTAVRYHNSGDRPSGLYIQNQIFMASFGFCTFKLIRTLINKES